MIKPKHVIILICGYLALLWLPVILVDFLNVYGIRDRLNIVVWQYLFANGRPVEWAQWYTIGATALMATYISASLNVYHVKNKQALSMFWLLMGAALILMLVEDAGNVRHEIRRIVENISGLPRHTGRLDKAVEFIYFTALASVPCYALIRYGKYLRTYSISLIYILCGFAFYAVAAICNATRNWNSWYASVGEIIQERAGLIVPSYDNPSHYGHWLMDALFEESLELLGAMFLLAAAVSFWKSISFKSHS